MEGLSIYHFIGISLVLIIMILTGIYSGRKVKNREDFATGVGQLNTLLIMGSLVGRWLAVLLPSA